MTYGVRQGAATSRQIAQVLLLVGCACLLAGPPLFAQGAQEEAPVVEASPVRPEELVSQTEAVREQVRQILGAFEGDSAYLAIENALVASTEQVSAPAGEALSRIEGSISVENLNTILVPWIELQEQAREWDRSLASRARQLQESLEELETLRSSWEAAETQAREEELPDSLLASISSTLGVIEPADQLLNNYRSSVLTLQQQVSEQLLTISPIFEEADRVQTQIQISVLSRDVAPIWLADWEELRVEKIQGSSVDFLEALSVYVRIHALQIALHLIFVLLCVWITHRVALAAHRARERGVEIGGTEVLLSRLLLLAEGMLLGAGLLWLLTSSREWVGSCLQPGDGCSSPHCGLGPWRS